MDVQQRDSKIQEVLCSPYHEQCSVPALDGFLSLSNLGPNPLLGAGQCSQVVVCAFCRGSGLYKLVGKRWSWSNKTWLWWNISNMVTMFVVDDTVLHRVGSLNISGQRIAFLFDRESLQIRNNRLNWFERLCRCWNGDMKKTFSFSCMHLAVCAKRP